MSDEGETVVCPDCGTTGILSRVTSRSGGEWYCRECNDHFDEPVTRQKQQPDGQSGLAYRLLRADPEEWP